MITQPMDVLKQFPVRKNRKQKESFRKAVENYVLDLGYSSQVEKGSFGVKNVVIGDPKSAKYLITAHYDTPANMLVPNLITPCNFLTFLGYQFAVVMAFLVAAFLIGGIAGILLQNPGIAGIAAMTVYWGMLFMMMLGPANKNNANDNTSGVVAVLEIARTLPDNLCDKVCFVLFDLEEAGLLGSAAYQRAHKAETENQIVLNMDCVGDGDEIILFPTKKLCRDKTKLQSLGKCVSRSGRKTVSVCHKGFRTYPSDQKNFPFGVGVAAFRRSKRGILYCSLIHTRKDKILEETNVNILRAVLTTYISQTEAEVAQDKIR